MSLSKRNSLVPGLLLLLLGMFGFSIWLAGCTANEPFDPDSIANSIPEVRFFVEPPGDEDLNTTSYLDRTFHWSGTDNDGWVTEFYISIETELGVAAPWDSTTAIDTTITFIPDAQGDDTVVTFRLACLDNRGALSDTLVQAVPIRNHPPTIIFQSNFEHLKNLQRDLIYEGEAVVDTIYWNWGPSTFRFNVYDLDGFSTMDDFYRYTTMDGEPDQEWAWDDPAADPETGWVVKPFIEEIGGGGGSGFNEFEIYLKDLDPGQRTLTVSVQDDVFGDDRFQYQWEVRAPSGPVLYIPDTTSPAFGRPFYYDILNEAYGEGNWDIYEFVYGFPDRPHVLLETMRKFQAVMWTDGGGNSSTVMQRASARDGVLQQYIIPQDESEPGRLLLISKKVAGAGGDGPGSVFIETVLGINAANSSPLDELGLFMNRQAQPQGGGAYLPIMAGSNNIGQGRGMDPFDDTEILYRMEYCVRCYDTIRPPFDPVIGIRRPHRDVSALANVVCFSLQLEHFYAVQVSQVLQQVLADEMGVTAP